MLIRYTEDSKSQTLRMHYRFQSTSKSISHGNGWLFCVYMILLRDFVPEWNSRPGTRTGVNSRWSDSRRHDILWWYHVNKYRAMRGNRSELALGQKSHRCHVNTPWVNALFTNMRIVKFKSQLAIAFFAAVRSPSNGASISINFLSQPFPSRFINRTASFARKVSYFRESRVSPWKNKIGWSRTQKPVLRPFSFFRLCPFLQSYSRWDLGIMK